MGVGIGLKLIPGILPYNIPGIGVMPILILILLILIPITNTNTDTWMII